MTEIPTRPGTRARRFSAENLRRVHDEAGLDPLDAEPTVAERADRLDPAQEDVWLFDLTTPEALVHQIALVVELTGPCVRGALGALPGRDPGRPTGKPPHTRSECSAAATRRCARGSRPTPPAHRSW